MGKIKVGDIGTRLRVSVSEGVTGLSSVNFLIRKPNDGTTLSVVGSTESVSTGIVYYDTTTNTFTEEGVHRLVVQLNFSDGDRFHTTTEDVRIWKDI